MHTIAYYQMAQGGYPFCGMRACHGFSTHGDLAALLHAMQAQAVVDVAGLRIFTVGPQALVWYLHAEGELAEPGLFLSALDADCFEALCAQWTLTIWADLDNQKMLRKWLQRLLEERC